MSRRKNQIFNLSFLDLVTGALGAVIFLFIITPKGGSSAPDARQVVMYMDTTEMKVFGTLHDSLRSKRVGDTLLTVLVDYKNYPKSEVKTIVERVVETPRPTPRATPKPTPKPVTKTSEKKPEAKPEPPKAPVANEGGSQKSPKFSGDAPSVPCKVSFEVSWVSKDDNVDFFVCKGNACVYGGRKRDRTIGQWDSGKSRNRLFNNDLRTTQEAVRQFDEVLPGEYLLYAQFKESKRNRTSVMLRGVIYTKGSSNQPLGETFTKTIPLSKSRTLLGKVILRADGSYQFIKR